jgi:D-methionine transport system permease protein
MVFFTIIFALIIGTPVGIFLNITSKDGIFPLPKVNKIVNGVINIFRSFPFLILMILVFPLSRFMVGASTGTKASIVPLAIATAPFLARIIENSLKEVDKDLIQAAKIMGSTNWQIIYKVLLPEALPSLVSGITLTLIAIVGNSAMAGAIGGGGLGDLAIRYGYHRFRTDVLTVSVIVIILIVSTIQIVGNCIFNKIIKRR